MDLCCSWQEHSLFSPGFCDSEHRIENHKTIHTGILQPSLWDKASKNKSVQHHPTSDRLWSSNTFSLQQKTTNNWSSTGVAKSSWSLCNQSAIGQSYSQRTRQAFGSRALVMASWSQCACVSCFPPELTECLQCRDTEIGPESLGKTKPINWRSSTCFGKKSRSGS